MVQGGRRIKRTEKRVVVKKFRNNKVMNRIKVVFVWLGEVDRLTFHP